MDLMLPQCSEGGMNDKWAFDGQDLSVKRLTDRCGSA